MTVLEQAALSTVSAAGGALALHFIKKWIADARKGQQAEEHKNFVTQEDCATCKDRHVNDMTAGNELFRIVLEVLSLNTQALVHLCEGDEGCRELLAKLQDCLARLASRQIAGR